MPSRYWSGNRISNSLQCRTCQKLCQEEPHYGEIPEGYVVYFFFFFFSLKSTSYLSLNLISGLIFTSGIDCTDCLLECGLYLGKLLQIALWNSLEGFFFLRMSSRTGIVVSDLITWFVFILWTLCSVWF